MTIPKSKGIFNSYRRVTVVGSRAVHNLAAEPSVSAAPASYIGVLRYSSIRVCAEDSVLSEGGEPSLRLEISTSQHVLEECQQPSFTLLVTKQRACAPATLAYGR